MNSQQLLYVNIILGILFLAYFIFGRGKPQAPTRLNLKSKETALDPQLFQQQQVNQKKQPLLESKLDPNSSKSKMTILEPDMNLDEKNQQRSQKDLAIFFLYNGHDWEAHHILGVPQGANMKIVTEGYQKMLSISDPKSYSFLEAAFKAILQKKRRDIL